MPDTIRQNPTLSELSPVQATVLLALSQGATITKAAQSAGIHRSTVYEWLRKDARFAAALQQSREDYVEALRDQLQGLSALALTALESLLEDPKTPPPVRLRAALAILQRPCYPDQGWNLPASINTPQEDEFVRDVALLKKDFEISRMEETVARNAPCPCGSGHKYKRCCGSSSPPKLGPTAVCPKVATG
jgi:AcrR family transcriptional regulator